jgi:hypothetical protein
VITGIATAGAALHSPACRCAACAPRPVQSPPDPVLQAAARAAAGERPAAEDAAAAQAGAARELTRADQVQVARLHARDREVRAHEAAHQAAGGGHAGAASFTYQQGPDGRRYAIGGEVPIDMSAISGDPAATIAKMARVRAAALAPAQPSAQDLAVASAAGRIAAEAQQELARLDGEARAAERAGSADEPVRTPRQRQAVEAYRAAGGIA